MKPFRIGTRGSPLALWQAHFVRDQLIPIASPREVELVLIETSGDIIRDVALAQLGGDGAFTKEIQKALLAEEVDLAVHSLKDLPTVGNESLTLGAIPPRGHVGDALVSKKYSAMEELPEGATIATSSLRRRAQLLQHRPDLNITDIRGNVDTRLRKLTEEDLDAIILAEAGLHRLGLQEMITEILSREWMLPAVGQGALGLECREGDQETLDLLAALDDEATHQCVLAERELLRSLGGGCQMPLGAMATLSADHLLLKAAVLDVDGAHILRGAIEGDPRTSEDLGRQLAEQLIDQGARDLFPIEEQP